MKDYVSSIFSTTNNNNCINFSSGNAYPIPSLHAARLHSISPAYVNLLTTASTIHEPKSYQEAILDPIWIESMDAELEALERNHTWEVVDLLPGKSTVGCTWKFKLMFNADGTLNTPKSHLVAQVFTQIEGLDYHDSFSPVAKWITIRVFLHIATVNAWSVQQVDINNAFLHGYLKEEIYIRPPPGYTKFKEGQVCKLVRSLYGLKQASCEWNAEFTSTLIDYGFQQSPHDHCLFIKANSTHFLALLVYVDDVLITESHDA